MRLNASKVRSTNLATAPVLESSSRISPPTRIAAHGNDGMGIKRIGTLIWIIDDSRYVSA
jgi:hypothetical protein